MSDYEFIMSLSIRHPSITLDEISRALKIVPLESYQSGDPRLGPSGETLAGTYRETFWMGSLMAAPEVASDRVSIESVILRILADLRKSFNFFTDLSRSGGFAELRVSIVGRSEFRLEFVPESLALLGRLGLVVSLSVASRAGSPTVALQS